MRRVCVAIVAVIIFLVSFSHAYAAGTGSEAAHITIILKEQPLKDVSHEINSEIMPRIESMVGEARKIYSKIGKIQKKEKRGRSMQQVIGRQREFLTGDDIARLDSIGIEIDALKDMAKAKTLKAVKERALEIHEAMRNYIEECGGIYTGSASVINSVTALVPVSCIEKLKGNENVLAIFPNGIMSIDMDVSAYSIKSDVFWNSSINGTGFQVAVVDTGIDGEHPALNGTVEAAKVFHDDALTDSSYDDNASTTDDIHSHGTHVSGTVAGRNDTYRGVAFGAGIINSKVCFKNSAGNGLCYDGDNMRGIDWAIEQGADIISRSIGMCSTNSSDCSMARYLDAVADDLGVHVANSAGNSGPGEGTVSAVAFNVFSVAAADDKNTAGTGDDSIAGFSSRGLTSDGRIKPDIAAPGTGITSASNSWESGPDYSSKSGTSMSAPHVAGAIALILDYKGINWNPEAVRALFYNTANDSFSDRNAYGFGYLDMDKAYIYRDDVITGNVTEGSYRLYKTEELMSNERATLAWNRHAVYIANQTPDTWHSLNNLDLYLYNESSGTEINSSESAGDNAEQVKASSSHGRSVLKVKAASSNFSHGSDYENFALATEGGFSEVLGPVLNFSEMQAPETTADTTFNITVIIINTGDISAHNTEVSLELPGNASIISGNITVLIGFLENNTEASITWEINVTDEGNYSFNANASSAGYGELFAATSPAANVVVDSGGPVVNFISPTPGDGAYANASDVVVNVTFDESASAASLEWDDINYSMSGSGSLWHRLMQNQSDGAHSYRVYAADTANNTGYSSMRSVVIDTAAPSITVNKPDGNYYSSGIPVNISLSEEVSVLGYTASGSGVLCSNCSGFTGTLNLSDGNYSVSFYATDYAGNTAEQSAGEIITDSTPPVINKYSHENGTPVIGSERQNFGVNYTEININATRFYWKINGSGFIEINITGCAGGTGKYCETSLNLTGYPGGTEIGFYFVIVDDSNRTAAGSEMHVYIDRDAPDITSASSDIATGMDSQTFAITAAISDSSPVSAKAVIHYSNGSFIENVTLENSSSTFRGTWTAPITPENYTYTIAAEDAAGNAASLAAGNLSTRTASMPVSDHSNVCSGDSYTITGSLKWENGTGIPGRVIIYSGLVSGSVASDSNGEFSVSGSGTSDGDVTFAVNNTGVSDVSSVTFTDCSQESSSPSSSSSGGGGSGGGGGAGGFVPALADDKEAASDSSAVAQAVSAAEGASGVDIEKPAELPAPQKTEQAAEEQQPEPAVEKAREPSGMFTKGIGGFVMANSRVLGIISLFSIGLVFEARRLGGKGRKTGRKHGAGRKAYVHGFDGK